MPPGSFPIGTGVPLDLGRGGAPRFDSGAAGPTIYNQSVSGALSFAGAAPLFAMNRSLAASLSFSGAAPLAAIQRSLTAVLHPVGALAKREARILTASFTPHGVVSAANVFARTLTAAALTFLGGTQLWPNDALYPNDNLWPYGGHILFQLNRILPAALTPSGTLLGHGSNTRTFTAILQPQVVFFKTSARVFLSAEFLAATLLAQRISNTTAKALFASLRNAGALSTILDPGHVDEGGGGFGVPMPDAFFQRYQPTLRRQKMRV